MIPKAINPIQVKNAAMVVEMTFLESEKQAQILSQ